MARPIGILAIGFYQPDWLVLPNEWFQQRSIINGKFVRNTGILQRFVSDAHEGIMAEKAVRSLVESHDLDLAKCVAVYFATNSTDPFGPMVGNSIIQQQAIEMGSRLGMELPESSFTGINFACSGYPAAFQCLLNDMPQLELDPDNFVLIITSNRTTNIMDFGCPITGAIFGDYCAATCVTPMDGSYGTPRFQILDAFAHQVQMPGIYIKFSEKDAIFPDPSKPAPSDHTIIPRKNCFWLDGMNIGENAPKLMKDAVIKAVQRTSISPSSIGGYVPHQAGKRIGEWFKNFVEAEHLPGEVRNGFTEQTGNTSSTSIPLVLGQEWSRLKGHVLCPTSGAGRVGHAEMSQGCLTLLTT